MSGPFMLWHGNPCWVSPYMADGSIVTVPRSWSEHKATGVDVSATFKTWDQLLAHNIANAYRPEGVP